MRNKRRTNYNEMIHRKLAEILIREAKDPRFKRITISRVDAARDLSFAKIYYSIFPAENLEELNLSLNKAAGFLSHCLGHALETRNTPRLSFTYDAGFDYTQEIEDLIKRVNAAE